MSETMIDIMVDGDVVMCLTSPTVPEVGDIVACTLHDHEKFAAKVDERQWIVDRDQRRKGLELGCVLVCRTFRQ